MQLMRHRSIETTMKYYVEHQADDVAADLWALSGSTLGSNGQNQTTTKSGADRRNLRKSLH